MNPAESETAVPDSVRLAKAVHVEDVSEEMASLSQKISSGRAFLKVLAYPWGVEFDVCDGDGPR